MGFALHIMPTYSPQKSWPIYPLPQHLYLNTMDIGLPALSPFSVNFMPSSPPLDASSNTNCWPDPKDGPSPEHGDLNYQFMEMATKKQGNCLLTSLKRLDYRHYLNNRKSTNYHGSLAKR